MAINVQDGTGSAYLLKVNSDGSINTNTTLTPLTNSNPKYTLIYISSGTATGINTGSEIGSIIQYLGTGSYVKVLSYSNNNLVNVGSWY